MTEEDIRLKNKIYLSQLTMQFYDGIRKSDFYKECVESALEYARKYPEKIDRYYIYYDIEENNVFYNDMNIIDGTNAVIMDYLIELNFDKGFEVERYGEY